MSRGKSICSVLKTIRKQVADANGIEYEPRECHHQGDCRGTCPACEAEVRYIQQQLDIRRQLGKAVAVVGISAGLAALSGCTNKPKNVDKAEVESSQLTEGKVEKKSTHDSINEEWDGLVDYSKVEKIPIPTNKRTVKLKTPNNNDTLLVAKEPEPPLVGQVIGDMPEFPGGTEKLFEFLKENIHYPEIAEENGVQGRVVVTFVVEVDGSISETKVVKSVDTSLDEEAIRVVKLLPKWNPAMLNGKPVRSKYTVPITFRLPESNEDTTDRNLSPSTNN
jgi:TonB family protein